MSSKLLKLVLCSAFIAAAYQIAMPAAAAQTSLFAVPTTDTLEKKRIYVEADFFAHFDKYQNGGFQSYSPSVIYGISKNVEAGVGLYATYDGESTAVELAPNVKWKAWENAGQGVAVATGVVAYVPLNRAAGTRTTGFLYANASKTFKSANELTLTGGIYRVIGGEDDLGTRTGAMIGVEQPVTKRLSFIADWTSGKNRFGYTNFGLGYEVNSSQYLTIGYSVGNYARGDNYLSAFYSFTF